MNRSPATVVCDAGPLIHLDELGCLAFLDDFEQVLMPEQVLSEVVQHRPHVFIDSGDNLRIESVSLSANPTLQTLVQSLSLDIGEQAALTLMERHPAAILLTDDAAARLAAVTLEYRVHGTIGVLIRAIRRQQRSKDEILAILQDLPNRSTLYIRPQLLQTIIADLQRR